MTVLLGDAAYILQKRLAFTKYKTIQGDSIIHDGKQEEGYNISFHVNKVVSLFKLNGGSKEL